MRITETACPWCRRGRITVHDPDEPWVVREESGPVGRRGPRGRPAQFKTSPVEWFSCTECAVTGTLSYLRMLLTGGVERYLKEAAIQRRVSALAREGVAATSWD